MLVKFEQELPALLELYEKYDVDGEDQEEDTDLNCLKLTQRLSAIGIWSGLMIFMEDFTEPFILRLAQNLRMTHPFMSGLESVGGLAKVFIFLLCYAMLN